MSHVVQVSIRMAACGDTHTAALTDDGAIYTMVNATATAPSSLVLLTTRTDENHKYTMQPRVYTVLKG